MDQDTESPVDNDAHTGERNRGSGIQEKQMGELRDSKNEG